MVEGFQVYLSDQESANAFHRKKFNIEGVELRANVKDLGYIQYIEIASDWLLFFSNHIIERRKFFAGFFKRINREVVVVRRVAFTSVNSSFTRVN